MEELRTIVDSLAEPKFYSIDDVVKILGWSRNIVNNLFNRKDFPSCDFGKEKKVERKAFIEYFSVPRRRKEEVR